MVSNELRVTFAAIDGEVVVLAVAGELNMRTSGGLDAAVRAAAGEHQRHLVLDLSGVPFCDSSGLNALITLRRRLHEAGGSLVLAAVPERLARLLLTTRVSRLISTYAAVADALVRHPHAGDRPEPSVG